MEESRPRANMAKSALLLMLTSAFGMLLSFLKESVMAYFYGSSATMDAYVVAVDLPVTLFSMISVALSVVFVPNYIKNHTDGGESAARHFFCNFVTLLVVVCAVFSLLLELASDILVYIASPGLSSETHDLAVSLFRIAIPSTALLILIHANNDVLNSHRSFVLPALGEPMLNVIFVVAVIFLTEFAGIYAAVIGTFVGVISRVIYSSILRRKYIKYGPVLDVKDPYIKKALQMSGPVFLSSGISEINKLIDKAIASTLSTGSIASLHYAAKITSAISGLLVSAISTVFYPEYAEKAAKKDDNGLASIFVASLNFLLIIIIPLIFGGLFLQREIVAIVYGRGAFDENSLNATAPLFGWYLVSLYFTAVLMFCTKFFNAYGETKIPVICSTVGVIVNIVLNLILSKFLGAPGLVLATVISSAISAVLLMLAAKRRNSHITYKSMLILLVKSITASGLMLVVLAVAKYFFECALVDLSTELNLVMYTVVAVLCGAITYAIGLWILRVNEFKQLVSMFKGRR